MILKDSCLKLAGYFLILAKDLGYGDTRKLSATWKRSAGSPIPVVYEQIRIDAGFRADLVVEDKVIVEIKSVELLVRLRLADKRLGLLINFHVPLIKEGITRIVNGLEDDDHAKSPSRKEP
jgi:hypothetical protein